MTLEVRRIVTGHNASGKAVVATDERLTAVPRLNRPHISGCEIWSTDRMPVDNSAAADAAQRAGFVKRYNYVGTGQGTVIRVTEFAPGAPKFMHRTETVDYAILLSGECDLEFDSGEIVRMKPGDIVVQRGTMHAWVNNWLGPGGLRLHPDRRRTGGGRRRKADDALPGAMTTRTIALAGTSLELLERGAGRPLLFLHAGEGLMPDRPWLDLLARHYRVIAPSHPGWGNSSFIDGTGSVDDLAYLYLDLAAELGLEDAFLVGACFGGWIATEMMVRSTAPLFATCPG